MERSRISRNRFHSTLSTAPCIQLSNISPRTLSRTKLYVKPNQTAINNITNATVLITKRDAYMEPEKQFIKMMNLINKFNYMASLN